MNEYVIIFDTETTGLNYLEDRIIEFAYVIAKRIGYSYFEVIKKRDYFIKQDIDIEKKEIDRLDIFGNKLTISKLTHITNSMLEMGISEEELINIIKKDFYSLENATIVAYNANFDLNMIKGLFLRHNENIDILKTVNYLDLLTVYKDYFPYDKTLDENGQALGHRLDSAVKTLEVEVKNTHRAIDDVLATLEVYKKILKQGTKIRPYINLFGFNPKFENELERLDFINYCPQPYGKKTPVLFYSLKKFRELKRN